MAADEPWTSRGREAGVSPHHDGVMTARQVQQALLDAAQVRHRVTGAHLATTMSISISPSLT
jgi:hypothetical protein